MIRYYYEIEMPLTVYRLEDHVEKWNMSHYKLINLSNGLRIFAPTHNFHKFFRPATKLHLAMVENYES
jgi:hypothetical protein